MTVQAAVPGPVTNRRPPLLTIRPRGGVSAASMHEVWQFRDLLLSLAGRDVRLRYKQTLLGAVWVVLQPLLGAGIFAFVFGKVANLSSGKVPYFIFSYVGLLGWNVFNTTLSKSSVCLVGNSQLISKIYFPRLVLPLSTIPSALIDFSVAAAMLIFLMPIFHMHPGFSILLMPVWLAMIVLLSMGLGLITAALTVSYRDVQYILPVLTQFLLYGSPVAYSVSELMKKNVPEWARKVYFLNPLSSLLEAFRWSILGPDGGDMMWGRTICASIACVLTFVVGIWAFKTMERRFADII
jgi:lipopolysaccharide transport system permease protein